LMNATERRRRILIMKMIAIVTVEFEAADGANARESLEGALDRGREH
jgi:hypothetical protein